MHARCLTGILGDHSGLIIAAAWLHDIGYAPAIATTGFHPLDGACYLRDHRWGFVTDRHGTSATDRDIPRYAR